MFGLLYYLFCLPIFQYIKCGNSLPSDKICHYGRLEDSAFAMKQMQDNPWIIVQYIGIICSISCFNVFGIATTKYASAAQRSTIDTSRTILIWICSVAFLGEQFLPMSIIGFVFLAFGTLMYNEIIEIPFCGFNYMTKKAIAKREGVEDTKDMDFVGSSPHAAYDSNRNKRAMSGVAERENKDEFLLAVENVHDSQVE